MVFTHQLNRYERVQHHHLTRGTPHNLDLHHFIGTAFVLLCQPLNHLVNTLETHLTHLSIAATASVRGMALAFSAVLVLFMSLALLAPSSIAQSATNPPAADEVRMFVFWGDGCPHCDDQKPFLRELEQRYPELIIDEREVWRTDAHHRLFIALALTHSIEPGSVPTAFLGGQVWVGDGPHIRQEMIQTIEREIAMLHASSEGTAGTPPAEIQPVTSHEASTAPPERSLSIPLVGQVDLALQPLMLTTILIAFIDGLNPCSLWVLTLLLGLVIHSGSRGRIALVGITFLTTTALIYGAFIAGVFSVLSYVLYLNWVQWLVAAFALTFGLVNIKDYFWFKTGPSFTIADNQKPGIYQSMRRLMNQNLTGMGLFLATVAMAAGIALVELPCTAGFPVLWSGIVAERGVSGVGFLVLLGIYLLIYLLIELIVFLVAIITLRMGRFQETQGRNLKLVGGIIMVALALILVINPDVMNDIGQTLLIFVTAIGLALLIIGLRRLPMPT